MYPLVGAIAQMEANRGFAKIKRRPISVQPMHSQTSPRQQLIQSISDLSDRQVLLLLQWIQALQKTPPLPVHSRLDDSASDPLAQFIGANIHGKLASAIDETLYG